MVGKPLELSICTGKREVSLRCRWVSISIALSSLSDVDSVKSTHRLCCPHSAPLKFSSKFRHEDGRIGSHEEVWLASYWHYNAHSALMGLLAEVLRYLQIEMNATL